MVAALSGEVWRGSTTGNDVPLSVESNSFMTAGLLVAVFDSHAASAGDASVESNTDVDAAWESSIEMDAPDDMQGDVIVRGVPSTRMVGNGMPYCRASPNRLW